MKSLNISKFLLFFKDTAVISKDDIYDFYSKNNTNVNLTTLNWRIYCLLKNNILSKISRSEYKVGSPKIIQIKYSRKLNNIAKILKNCDYSNCNISMYDNALLNSLFSNSNILNSIVIEADMSILKKIFFHLADAKQEVLFNPDFDDVRKINYFVKRPIFVVPLISESPILQLKDFHVTTPEKLIVDMIAKPYLYFKNSLPYYHQVFNYWSEKHYFNKNKMYRYARRRNKLVEVKKLFNN